ncbi:MAG: hypothetical protein COA91_07730 [Robiginitomaculum sp.]|nr:MAG: hypothetical protein COA91_07730 [Robiginitomaculum sp.]
MDKIKACNPYAGPLDTQLGALRQHIGTKINAVKMRDLFLQQVLEVASVVMETVAARDMITQTGMKSPPRPYLAFDSWRDFVEQPDVYGAICGDIQTMATHSFAALGMETRYISMFENINYKAGATNNHASTEVWIYDRWVAIDLTFGIYFEDLLSWSEVREILLAEKEVHPVYFGNALFDFRKYHVPLKQLVRYMAVGTCPVPDKVCLLGALDGKPWDGWIKMAKGDEPIYWPNILTSNRLALKQYWKFSVPYSSKQ